MILNTLKPQLLPLFLLLLAPFFGTTLLAQPTLFLNEFMASNQNFLLDEDGDDSDWIELYNAAALPQSLLGYALSDKANELNRWALPDTVMAPGEFLVVFASGKDRRVVGQPLHTNFSIAAAGEALFLSHNGQLVHTLGARALESNQSAGLVPDGSTNYLRIGSPSPGYTNAGSEIAEVVHFNRPGGFYTQPFHLALLSSRPDFHIRYTLNGDQPTASSPDYGGPLLLSLDLLTPSRLFEIPLGPQPHFIPDFAKRCILVRAALFDNNGQRMSRTFTQSYLIGDFGNQHQLPVVSISADSLALFSFDSGIFVPGRSFDPAGAENTGNYYQRGRDWERWCNVEYIENGSSYINQQAGLRVHGNSTRKMHQKAMRLYARSSYGPSKFNHAFFPEKDIDRFDRLVLKPFGSAWSSAGIQDHWANYAAAGLNMEFPGSKPVVVYLNGTYWGIYYLQERTDEKFITAHYPAVEEASIEIVDHWWGHGLNGPSQDFLQLMDFVYGHDLSDPAHYARVADWIDIDNFIDYQLFQIIIANTDWPGNNMKCWREMKPGGKWRWIFHDADGAVKDIQFKSMANAMAIVEEGWPSNARSTQLLRALLRNPGFKQAFLARADALLLFHFNVTKSFSRTNEIAAALLDEVNNNIGRFNRPASMQRWFREIDRTLNFAAERPCVVAKELAEVFGHRVPLDYACEIPKVPVFIEKLYPNPNRGTFALQFESVEAGRCKLEIYDLSGRCHFQTLLFSTAGLNTYAVNAQLEEGLYVLQLSTHYHTAAHKLHISK